MHHIDYAAVPPLAPALPAAGEGLAALFPLIAWGICLSLLYVWRRTIGALIEHLANLLDFGVGIRHLGHVHPFGLIVSGLREIDNAIQSALDAGAKATERATVYLFHKSLATFTAVGRELYHIAEDAGRALDTLIIHTIPRLVKVGIHGLEHTVEQNLRVYRAMVARTDTRVSRLRDDVHSIGHSTAIALPRDIGRVRTREGRLEHDVEALKAHVGKLAALATLAGFSAFMWRWMGRFGLRWLRCPSLARIGSQLGCVGFGFLESLLFLAWETFAVLDLCRFADGMTKLAEEMRPLMMEFVDVEEALVGCRGATTPPKLSVPKLTLPPANAGLVLAQPGEGKAFVIAPGVLPGVGAATA